MKKRDKKMRKHSLLYLGKYNTTLISSKKSFKEEKLILAAEIRNEYIDLNIIIK
jgi:hypothetical protein